LKRFTEKLGIDEDRLESFLINVQEHCFKKNKETNDFIKGVNDACGVSNRMEMSIEGLPQKLEDMVNELNQLVIDIKRKKTERVQMLLNYRITERQLEEYNKTGLLRVVENLRLQLDAVKMIASNGRIG
jgi:hypothetical protein